MSTQDYSIAFTVDASPEEVFAAVNNVRGWWSGEIEGPTDQLGGQFTYRYLRELITSGRGQPNEAAAA
jgi:hypothetical protein